MTKHSERLKGILQDYMEFGRELTEDPEVEMELLMAYGHAMLELLSVAVKLNANNLDVRPCKERT